MIDLPPEPPIQQEQVIAQKLVDCGLDAQGFTVKYEDYLQSIEIVIGRDAGATENQFACINRAAGHEIVTFRENALQSAYTDFMAELYRPQMIADATAGLKKLGLLDNFPKRTAYESLADYARALESHCGLIPGSALKAHGEGISFQPPREVDFKEFSKKYSGLIAAIMYANAIGDSEGFGFIGNAAIAEAGKR
ncbi:hypothetical protein DFR49_3795 [Hephaestia caeni]|uniref:Uncharacterized protein n=1 Tax=Hephaestia caeni TaxID=645617 RepID=A0A397NT56_9SPHN|nr:hypothetical protein [Hephaestia caeni]RIA37905.1 hypothetical protein DFR49_3795 [Hephaestia caeni]